MAHLHFGSVTHRGKSRYVLTTLWPLSGIDRTSLLVIDRDHSCLMIRIISCEMRPVVHGLNHNVPSTLLSWPSWNFLHTNRFETVRPRKSADRWIARLLSGSALSALVLVLITFWADSFSRSVRKTLICDRKGLKRRQAIDHHLIDHNGLKK